VTSPRRTCVKPAGLSPITGYRNYGCRCYDCSSAANRYDRDKAAAVKAGTWQPFIDSAPVIAHLEALREQGVGFERIAKAAGLQPGMVCKYTNQYQPRPKRIRPESAAALLAVTAHAAVSAGQLVPSVGTRRRAQALAAIGWSLTAQAEQVGAIRTV